MPTLEAAYFRTLGELEAGPNQDDLPHILKTLCDLYDLKTAAYFGVNVSRSPRSEPYLAVTYSNEWVAHYKARSYVALDPVIRAGFSSLLPVEWSGLDARDSRLKRFFGEAGDFGVGHSGISIPIRGRCGDRALLTLTTAQSPREWKHAIPRLKRDFQMAGYHLHQTILRAEGRDCPIPRLTPRELECLKWKAAGKTDWETSMILGLSEKTIRFYLDIARVKLNATNVTHAVAKAIHLNLFWGTS